MNKIISFLAVIMGVLCLTSSVFAAGGANADASAKIQTAIAVVKYTETVTNGDLGFGVIVPGTATIVTVSTASVRSKDTGTAALLGNAYGAATFMIYGSPDATYTVTKPSVAITVTNGSQTMAVDNWTSTSDTYQNGIGQCGAEGQSSFLIGGSLHVGASQAVGQYTGEFTVSVAYN